MTSPLLEVHDLVKTFPASGRGTLLAIDGVSFTLDPGETLGLVGESGCGKSTIARLLLGLIRPTSGRMLFGGRDIAGLRGRQLRALRRDIQMVFQDPFSSLDPRMTVDALLREPLRVHGLSDAGKPARIAELLDVVGLPRAMGGRYPHELSGGQQQRVGIARALVLDPKVLLLDEPVSALDVSIRSQVLNLLVDLQSRFGFAFLFISHDLSVVRHVSHRVAVMYLGRIVETGSSDSLYRRALHPYSQALLSAVPIADPRVERARRRILLTGDPPSALNPPPGCSFHPRCWKREEVCEETSPPLEPHDPLAANHLAACHFAAPNLSMTAGRAGTPPLAGVPPGEAVRGSSSESS